MAKKIEYLDGAKLDFNETFDWYAERRVEAARGFAIAVDEALERIVDDPNRFPVIRRNCRYCTLKRYPFRIVYREEVEQIVVIAIAHAKRRPGYWHRRL